MTASMSCPRGGLAVALLTLSLAASGLAGCSDRGTPDNKVQAQASANPCGDVALALDSTLPKNNTGSDQATVDCAAWQAFIALNWRADPSKPGYPDPAATPADFGTPGDKRPTVWETYLEAATVFGGNAPLKGLWEAKRPAAKSLIRTSKFGALDLSAIVQAGSGDHWLTNQRGDVTYYEVMMNRDEFLFITTQQDFDLTTAAGQLHCALQRGQQISDEPPPPPNAPYRGGLSLPSGQASGWSDTDCTGKRTGWGDGVGAMEIKAAWTPLPADHSLDYRYKTATAEIQDPRTKSVRTVTVGLVGLHIIRKTIGRQQWIWATFEQIDNSPDEAAGGGFSPPALPHNSNQQPSPGFTFFNPACNPANDPAYGCVHNAPPTPCLLGSTKCQPYNAPMQITRLNPVADPANSVTAYVWSLLAAQAPQSVFNYYRLINVQWPQQSQIVPAGQRLPLPFGNPTPPVSPNPDANPPLPANQIIANTTLESFQQSSASCMDCHARYTQIAMPNLLQATVPGGLRRLSKGTGKDGLPPFASDYSFIFITETKR